MARHKQGQADGRPANCRFTVLHWHIHIAHFRPVLPLIARLQVLLCARRNRRLSLLQLFFSLEISPITEPNSTLVNANVEVPKTLIMNIYAISVFGTAVTLPIVLIIYKFSSLLEVQYFIKIRIALKNVHKAYHPTITKIRIMLAITLLHIMVDIPALICEYFYVDKVCLNVKIEKLTYNLLSTLPLRPQYSFR